MKLAFFIEGTEISSTINKLQDRLIKQVYFTKLIVVLLPVILPIFTVAIVFRIRSLSIKVTADVVRYLETLEDTIREQRKQW